MDDDAARNHSAILYVLTVDHEYGIDVELHATRSAAEASIDRYVQTWWEREMDEPIPATGVDRERYFEETDEAYVIYPIPLSEADFARALKESRVSAGGDPVRG